MMSADCEQVIFPEATKRCTCLHMIAKHVPRVGAVCQNAPNHSLSLCLRLTLGSEAP